MINSNTIDEVKNRLVSACNPFTIYLFGSYAWGTPHDESDLDLAIIIDSHHPDIYNLTVEGHKALFGLKVAKDLLVYSKKDFEKRSQDITSLCHKIKHEGKIIYAKA